MEKIKNFICLLMLVFSISSAFGDTASLRTCIQQTYESQVGVHELTGKNDGKQVEAYLKTCGLGKGHAWCAAFITWVYKTCGIKACVTAWAPAWFPEDKVIYKRGTYLSGLPQPGDVGGIWFESKKRIAHVLFIHKWSDTWVYTVEGNTNEAGSREGDGVYKKKRLRKQIYIVAKFI